MTSKAKKVVTYGILICLCLILSYVERIIPLNFAVPGIKLGLSNMVVLYALYSLGGRSAFFVNILRILITGMLFSNVATLLYSVSGGLLSFLAMILTKKIKTLSIISVSVMGGIFHNIGQILMASIVLSSEKVFYYLPVLLISGVVTGILTGYISAIVIERIYK